jgi:Tol biopolymer transport system component
MSFIRASGTSISSSGCGRTRPGSRWRRRSAAGARGGLLAAALLAGLGAAPARAQYFGQNKVQYRHLKFSVIATEHFDVHFYEEERAAALDAARMAERAYARLSRILNHEYRERQPILLFASHSEFQQNNVTDIGDATGGVTDAYRHRIMLPLTGSYEDFEHVLQHEMVHQFQYDVFARGRIGAGIPRLIAVQPPLWLIEGMAEYLSLGPVTPLTAAWLRNAALEGHLPTIEEMTYDPSVFPYRYGHALMAYLGERWGDEVIGEVLHAVAASGVEAGFRQALHLSLEDLSAEWHYEVRKRYLPSIAEYQPARLFARPGLNERRTGGSMHVSPALAPDGARIAYLSEGRSFFVDLYVADLETGRHQHRLSQSAFSSELENLRYLYSSGSWSPDGRFFAIAAKHGGRDNLVIFDMARRRVARRIEIPLHGATTPSWSPDGSRLVFTGYDGGLTDLFLVNGDGTDLRRLTRDRYADLQPAWSPDGRTIAFVTDRGPETDFAQLAFAPLRIGLYDLPSGTIQVLTRQEGRNINPQWAPDGRSLAYISDRTGIANVFLYDLDEAADYQLTSVLTAVTGITELSPAISWAAGADRLAFTYYEGRDFTFSVYWLDDPRSLKREPWQPTGAPALVAMREPADTPADTTPLGLTPESLLGLVAPGRVVDRGRPDVGALARRDSVASPDSAVAPPGLPVVPSGSFYRGARGFRESAAPVNAAGIAEPPLTVKQLLDSAALALPDTGAFQLKPYSGALAPDYVAQPSIGYTRDNFGRGFYGGAAIQMSDLLGNRRLLMAAQINGRLDEAQALFAYGNQARRINWVVGYEQFPLFYFTGSGYADDPLGLPASIVTYTRYVHRRFFLEGHLPLTRFRRIEFGFRPSSVSIAQQTVVTSFDPVTGGLVGQDVLTEGLGTDFYVQPSLAFVFDNSVSLWVGPWLGRRSRLEYAPAFGDVRFHQFLADYRRYDRLLGPFILATRTLFYGRFGRNENDFRVSIGNTDFLRGYTIGSLRRNECVTDVLGRLSGCSALDQLIGTRFGVFNAELRFPLFRALGLGFLPVWLPPIEGALFFDAGIAWEDGTRLAWSRKPYQNPAYVRQPLTSWGFSLRANLLGFAVFRFDYTNPLTRPDEVPSYWTISLGPTF